MALILVNVRVRIDEFVTVAAVHVRVLMLVGRDVRVQHASRHQHKAEAVKQTYKSAKHTHGLSVA